MTEPKATAAELAEWLRAHASYWPASYVNAVKCRAIAAELIRLAEVERERDLARVELESSKIANASLRDNATARWVLESETRIAAVAQVLGALVDHLMRSDRVNAKDVIQRLSKALGGSVEP